MRQSLRCSLPLVCVLAALPWLFAGRQQEELPEGVTAEMVEAGRQTFANVCYTCHGRNGEGTPIGPNLTDQEWLHIDGSYNAIVELVKTGVPTPEEHPMPMLPKGGSDITEEQVREVAAYVWTLSPG